MKVEENIVVFDEDNVSLSVKISPEEETVWLNRNQIAELFGRDVKTIGKHINNALKEELQNDKSVVAKFATTAEDGKTYQVEYYNLDVILSVGYRVKSSRGIHFRRWSSSVLKPYLVKGYALNEKKFAVQDRSYITNLLEQYRISNGRLEISGDESLSFLIEYDRALTLLDNYDHETLAVPDGTEGSYVITYSECIDIIHKSNFSTKNDYLELKEIILSNQV